MQSLGEKIAEGIIVSKLLRSTPEKYDPIKSSTEQFGDLDTMTLDEAIGSLKIHEDKLRDHEEEREDQAYLASLRGKTKDHHCGHEGEREKKDRDKVKCFKCHRYGHLQLLAAAATMKMRRLTLLKRWRNLRLLSCKQWWKISQHRIKRLIAGLFLILH